jgi:DNA transposition AAA+ family ATPase
VCRATREEERKDAVSLGVRKRRSGEEGEDEVSQLTILEKKAENYTELMERLNVYVQRSGISQKALGQRLGYSPASVSMYLAGTFTGDFAKINRAVHKFLEMESEKQLFVKPEQKFVMIKSARIIQEVCRKCHRHGEMGVVYAHAGAGKTYGFKHYEKSNHGVYLLEADARMTKTALLKAFHRAVGYDGSGRLSSIQDDIMGRLNGSGALVIIDEAEHVSYDGLESMRRIYDKCDNTFGLLFGGMPRLMSNLQGKRREYAQIYSRLDTAVQLDTISLEDTRLIIEAILPNSIGIYQQFHSSCKSNLRTLSKLISNASQIAHVNEVDIDDHVVATAAKLLVV